MSSIFEANFFIANRQNLMNHVNKQVPIILVGNGLSQKSADINFPFKQDSSFWYLTGLNLANLILVIDEKNEYLIVPDQTHQQKFFDGEIDLENLKKTSGINTLLNPKKGWELINNLAKTKDEIATLESAPVFIEGHGMFAHPARKFVIDKILNTNSKLKLVDLRPKTSEMRMIKQQPEIETIKKAISITNQAIDYVHKKFSDESYRNEFEIELELSRLFVEKGAEGHGFEPIIASGKKACIIHPSANRGEINYDEPLLIDVGAQLNNYNADISRTWMLKPSKRFQAVYESVKDTAEFAKSLLKPGIVLKEYEKKIEAFMGKELMRLNLINKNEPKQVRQYYPHSTSHFLGIDVHDVGDYQKPLQENSVLTVEPGIYIPKEGIGIRIEEDVLITKTKATTL